MTKFERKLALRNSCMEKISCNFRYAVQFQRTHKEYLLGLQEIWSNHQFKSLPRYMQNYLHGFERGLYNQLHQCIMFGLEHSDKRKPLLEWVLTHPLNGKHYRENDDSWLNEVPNDLKSTMPGNHVWRAAMDKGEWKPF